MVCIAFDIGYVWIHFNGDKHKAYQTTYVTNLDNLPERPFVFEFEYHPADELGEEMLEMKMTAYTDYLMQDSYCYGVQILKPSKMILKEKYIKPDIKVIQWKSTLEYEYVLNLNGASIKYFNSDDFISYKATTSLNENNTPYLISMGDKVYAMEFNRRTYNSTNYGMLWYKKDIYYTSSFEYFIYKMYDSISNITTGPGIYEHLDFQLNDVFQYYSFNSLTGKFDQFSDMTFNSDFIGIKVTINNRSARIHEDSLFGQIGDIAKGGIIFG